MRDALREAALAGFDPVLHRPRRGRQRGADPETHDHARNDQRDKSGGKTRQHGRARPYQSADEQSAPRTEAISRPTPDDLEKQIGIAEDGKYEEHLRIGQPEL